MTRPSRAFVLLFVLALLSGCAAGQAFKRGEERAKVGDWDSAVTYYRQAMQASPEIPEYRIALERAMLNASRVHFDSARQLEAKDQLDAALQEYRRTVEYEPGQYAGDRQDRHPRADDSGSHRGRASQAANRAAARRGTPDQRDADPQSGIASAARIQVHGGQPARYPHVHQQRDGHQRHLRRQLPGSPGDDHAHRIDRAGAQHAALVQWLLLHRARRPHDRRGARFGAEPPEVPSVRSRSRFRSRTPTRPS